MELLWAQPSEHLALRDTSVCTSGDAKVYAIPAMRLRSLIVSAHHILAQQNEALDSLMRLGQLHCDYRCLLMPSSAMLGD